MQEPDFLVHNETDSVGVVVVETVVGRRKLSGWIMDRNATIELESLVAIPLGHKIALADIAKNDTIVKYGHDIGKAVINISRGDHVHVHNVKTKRW